MANEFTLDWRLYEQGKRFKSRLNLYNKVDKNYRFYEGDQWHGVQNNGLPTPVFNVIKRVVDYKIASLISEAYKVNYAVENPQQSQDETFKDVINTFNGYVETAFEQMKMDSHARAMLRDSAVTGDGVSYFYFDPFAETGQAIKGKICVESIDNVNYIPGNPNEKDVQKQPYIELPSRKLVSEVKEIALKNGVPENEISRITGDTDYQYQAGDNSKKELESMNDDGKTTVLLKLWKNKQTNTIWFQLSTKDVEIQKPIDTGLKRYPVAILNWDESKNSCHGKSEVENVIPNQIIINKLAAAISIWILHNAFPKLIYDANLIKAPSNQIGTAIPIDGSQGNVNFAASYLKSPSISAEVFNFWEMIITYVKELSGANEAALGEVKPDNTSAIIAVQKAAAVPLEPIKARLRQYYEDVGLILMDFWTAKYQMDMQIPVNENGETVYKTINPSQYRDLLWTVKIDVGPSAQWSEITALQTLDNLLTGQFITFTQYLKRLPDGIMPQRQELIDELEALEQQAQAMQQQQAMAQGQPQQQPEVDQEAALEEMAQFIDQLPPEVQASIHKMEPDQMESTVAQLMQMAPEELQQYLMEVTNGQ